MKDVSKILVNENATIKEAMRVIDQGAIKTAIVVNVKNELLGMVTDGDIRRGILNGVDIQEKVSQVMNKEPTRAFMNSSKEEIFRLIKEKQITGLPLVDEKKIVKEFVLLSKGVY